MARKHQENPADAGGAPQAEPTDGVLSAEELAELEAEDLARAEAAQQAGAAVEEPADEAVRRLEREAGEWKDRALRTAADFDNFRKRAIREREETYARGQADVIGRIVDVVDDLARVAHLEPATTTSEALHEGMLAIERKFLKVLETAGVERLDPAGQPFDPNLHEAVAVLPATEAAQDQTVAAVYQQGYRLKGTLLRPARVAVFQWSGASASADAR